MPNHLRSNWHPAGDGAIKFSWFISGPLILLGALVLSPWNNVDGASAKLFGLLFIMMGLILTGMRQGSVLDKDLNVATKWRGFFRFPVSQENMPIPDQPELSVVGSTSNSSSGRSTRHRVYLLGEKELCIYMSDNRNKATRWAESTAEFLSGTIKQDKILSMNRHG